MRIEFSVGNERFLIIRIPAIIATGFVLTFLVPEKSGIPSSRNPVASRVLIPLVTRGNFDDLLLSLREHYDERI